MTATAEPVLGRLEHPATVKVGVFLFHTQSHHGVHHVLQFVCTSHLAVLVDLPDGDGVAEILFAVVGDCRQAAFGRLGIDATVCILPIIEALQAINDQEERPVFIAALLTELITVFQQRGNVSFLAGDETVTEAEAFSDQLHLEEALFGGVEQDNCARLGQAVCELEHHRGFTRSGCTGEQRDCGGRESLTTQSTIDVLETGSVLYSQLFGYLDVENVGSKLDIIIAYVQFH